MLQQQEEEEIEISEEESFDSAQIEEMIGAEEEAANAEKTKAQNFLERRFEIYLFTKLIVIASLEKLNFNLQNSRLKKQPKLRRLIMLNDYRNLQTRFKQ